MPYERQPSSPSRIPRFTQTASTAVALAGSPTSRQEFGCSKETVRELLDELITAVVQQVPETAAHHASEPGVVKPSRADDSSRASAVGRSAITALKEGIDAKCDEPFSIETLEALDSTADDLLLSLPEHVAGQGTTLQDLADLSCSADLAAASLEVDGPPDSWLCASGDLSAMPSVTQHSSLQLSFLGPSWDEYLSGMDQRLATSSSTNTLPGAMSSAAHAPPQSAASAQAPLQVPAGRALGRTSESAARAADIRMVHTSPSSSSTRVIPTSPTAGIRAAAGSRNSRAPGSPLASRPGSPSAARCGPGSPTGTRSPARWSPHGSPRAAAPRSAMLSSRSAGSTAVLPAPLRAATATAMLTQQQQQLMQEDAPLSQVRAGSSSSADRTSSIQQEQQQHGQTHAAAATAPGTSPSPNACAGLDVILVRRCRRSSSSSSSSGGSRHCSLAADPKQGVAPRDESTTAWMSSLRIAVPSSSGSKKTPSRSQSLNTGTPPLSSRSSARLQHSRSARLPALGLDAAGEATTPPATLRSSSKCGRITPRSASSLTHSMDGMAVSSSRHAHLSLRPSRAGSSRSASVSPHAAAHRSSFTTPVSPRAAAAPLPLSAAAAAGAAAAQCTAPALGPVGAEGQGGTVPRANSTVASQPEVWPSTLHAAALPTLPAVAGLRSCGGDSELLSSDQEIMADPTAVKLFMELNEEIEAEGRAAMAAAAAQADAAAAAAAAAAASGSSSATAAANTDRGAASRVPRALPAPVSSLQGHDPVEVLAPGDREAQLLLQPQPQLQSAGGQSIAADAAALGDAVQGVQSASHCGSSASAAPRASSSGNAAAPSTASTAVTRPESQAGAGTAQGGAASATSSSGGSAAQAAAHAYRSEGGGSVEPEDTATVGTAGDLQDQGPQQPSCGCRCVIM